MQRESGIAMRVERYDDADAIVMALRRKRVRSEGAAEAARLLGIDPGAPGYRVTYGHPIPPGGLGNSRHHP